MPGYDQTGPAGYGPGTGRGLGPCGRGIAFRSGFPAGFGRGFGRGRGYYCRRPFWDYYEPRPMTKEEEERILRAELKQIEEEKEEIQRRLSALE
jgi:hypothetical protein